MLREPMLFCAEEAVPFLIGSSEPVEIQAGEAAPAEGGKKKLATFKMTAYTGGPMKLAGYFLPVVVDLSSTTAPRQSVPVPLSHDMERIVGHTSSIDISAQRIKASGVVSSDEEHAAGVVSKAANGFPWQASIGASPTRMERVEAGESITVNGRTFQGPLLVARGVQIKEISLVPIGADGNTAASISAQSYGGSAMDFEAWLKANGYDTTKITPEKRAELQASYDTAHPKPAPTPTNTPPNPAPVLPPAPGPDLAAQEVARIRAAASGELARHTAIGKVARKHGVDEVEIEAADGKKVKVNLVSHAIESGWTSDQTELIALRAARPVPSPHFYVPGAPQMSEAVLEAAVLQAGRCELFDDGFYRQHEVIAREQRQTQTQLRARYTDQVQQSAHDLYRGRIGLQQVLIAAARATGRYRGGDVLRDDGDIQAMLQGCDFIRADGSSTMSIANVLANVMNKFLLQGYLYVEQTWRQICGVRSMKDFKPSKSINLFGDFTMKKIGPDGEIKHGTLQDQAFANQVDTYARMLNLSRKYIINDDLSAMTTVPTLFGRGSGLTLADLAWALMLNPGNDEGGSTAFWAAVHTIANQQAKSNYMSGGASALSSAALTTATVTFDKQVDPTGKPLGVDASILLYPPELDSTARELMNSQNIVYGGASASKQPQSNIWQGRFTPLKSRYLSNPAYTNFSTTGWFLLASPSILPVIEVAYLNGAEQPTVETAMADFNQLGIQMRGFFDVGFAMQNFRGGVYSAGQ